MTAIASLLSRNGAAMAAPIGIVFLLLAFAVSSSYFLTPPNLLNVAGQAGPLAILAVGQMMVLITGGFDISVGAVVALAGVSAALSVNALGTPGIVVGPVVGLAVGAINGVLVGRVHVQPMITTLGTLLAARGAALLVSGSSPVALSDPSQIAGLGYADIFGVPQAFLFAAALGLVAWVFARRIRMGRRMYVVGSNRWAATLIGIDVSATLMWAYALSGLSAGLASVVFLSRAGSALPTFGDGLELQAIAAAVIGGTSLAGGSGSVPLVFVGALFIQLLGNGLNLLGMSPFLREVVLGSVIIVAGLLDYIVRRFGSVDRFRNKEWTLDAST